MGVGDTGTLKAEGADTDSLQKVVEVARMGIRVVDGKPFHTLEEDGCRGGAVVDNSFWMSPPSPSTSAEIQKKVEEKRRLILQEKVYCHIRIIPILYTQPRAPRNPIKYIKVTPTINTILHDKSKTGNQQSLSHLSTNCNTSKPIT